MVELADVESLLTLFAEGIAGRYYHIKATDEFSSNRVTLNPQIAALSRDTIYVPPSMDYPDSAAYRVMVMQQLGLQEFGTYRFDLQTAKAAIPALAALPAPAPALRESDFELFYHHVKQPRLLKHLFNGCERARVMACVLARYPGVKRHLEALQKHQRESVAAAPIESLTELLAVFDLYADGVISAPEWHTSRWTGEDFRSLLDFALSQLATVAHPRATVYDCADAALSIYTFWLQQVSLVLASVHSPGAIDEGETTEWMQRDARLEDWEKELSQLENMLVIEMLEGDEVTAGNTENLQDGELRPTDIDIRALQSERDTLSRRLDMERSAIRDALGTERPLARSYRYDEWDHTRQRYLRHWCRLFEERLAPDTESSNEELKRVIRTHSPAVLKQLEQIKPLGYQRVSRVMEGDELDFKALIDARLDIRAGKSPDERIYSRKERVHRDVCAVFLVDLSASTDDPVEPAKPLPPEQYLDNPGELNLRDPFDDDVAALSHEVAAETKRRRIIDVQRESMLIMSAALERLGDSYGIYGFSGYGRDCVEFFVAKEPDEPFTQATLQAIAGMSPKRSTRMGPAIRHSTNKLVASGNALKLLIILSDGFPQDADYGPLRGDHEYGLQDTAKSLEEAQAKGVQTICVTVDKSGHDYLKKMCSKSRYLVIEEIEDLPEALSQVYQTLAV
jgi:hypothetical protein